MTRSSVPGLPPIELVGQQVAPKLTVGSIAASEIERLASDWRELEPRAQDVNLYSTFDWLSAWASAYEPKRLLFIRIVAKQDELIALGLVELSRLRGWRFAGGSPTSRRSLLCATGHEDTAWRALAGWLGENPLAWSTLEGSEVPRSAESIPGARLSANVTPVLATPESWDSYLASLSSKRRADVRRRLRLTHSANLQVREISPSDLNGALEDFLRLHHLRTDFKGERHPDIDRRLTRLLATLAGDSSIRVSLVEIRRVGVRVAIRISLEHRRVLYLYNHGWDPEFASLAPGIVLALNSIEEAIDRKVSVIDMGTGEQSYKMGLGAVAERRFALEAHNPRIWARAVRSAYATYARVRP
jgi:CelD/BcsL family acetyltransferase involved in cellulose biosynthesis